MLILIGGDHQIGTGNNLNNGLFSYSDNASLQFDNTFTQAKIMGQANSNTTIEQLRLSDGSFLTNADINQIVQTMGSVAMHDGISLNSLDAVKNNTDLMAVLHAAWHH